jgi:hypothetical protein
MQDDARHCGLNVLGRIEQKVLSLWALLDHCRVMPTQRVTDQQRGMAIRSEDDEAGRGGLQPAVSNSFVCVGVMIIAVKSL